MTRIASPISKAGQDAPVFLTANELMSRWRMKKTAFYENIQSGNIPDGVVIGRKKLWPVESVVEYERKQGAPR